MYKLAFVAKLLCFVQMMMMMMMMMMMVMQCVDSNYSML